MEGTHLVLGLLGLVAVLLLVVVCQLGVLVGLLRRRVGQPARAPGAREEVVGRAAGAQNQQFNEFIKEDPARARLPKSELYAAFRRWRQEKGYSWGS